MKFEKNHITGGTVCTSEGPLKGKFDKYYELAKRFGAEDPIIRMNDFFDPQEPCFIVIRKGPKGVRLIEFEQEYFTQPAEAYDDEDGFPLPQHYGVASLLFCDENREARQKAFWEKKELEKATAQAAGQQPNKKRRAL